MKTQEELQHELHKQVTSAEDVMIKLNKAGMLLGLWLQDYGFNERPDPKGKWFFEYDTIYKLIDIVHDYVYESEEALRKMAYGKKGAKFDA